MYELDKKAAQNWGNQGGWWFPGAVDVTCPHCDCPTSLPTTNLHFDGPRKTVAANARCPRCSGEVGIWLINPGTGKDANQKGNGTLGYE